jgi:predicted nucleotidyltransferase
MNGMNWRDFVDSLYEVEEYQRKVRKGYTKDRNKYTQTGPQRKGGAPFEEEPPKTRAKSAPPGFGGSLEEDVEPESFDTHDTLETRIWDDEEIRPKIARMLTKIAQDFIDGLPVEIDIEDIRLTGSLANYNWSNYSDVDLHIIVDFLSVDENRALVKSFFDNARMRWNNKHQITMKGYDVEIYVEDAREQHLSSGVYSLLNNEWIKRPQRFRNNIDFFAARRKADDIEFQVNIVNNLISTGKLETAMKNVARLKKKIKDMRRAGLESTMKEFSIENIAFKILRRNGVLRTLDNFKNQVYDRVMTINEE